MDVGSISVNTLVIISGSKEIIFDRYSWCHGRPFHVVRDLLTEIDATFGLDSFATISFTGSGGKKMAELTGGSFINEVIAQSTSVSALYNEIRTIIEMGGEDSKLIMMEKDGVKSVSRLSDSP
ncbi:MAG: hypothetical protein R2744_08520 [Bacteroidales bacterium]